MSEIDQYKHKCIGIITCPSIYEIVAGNDSHRNIPIYRLDESTSEWNSKQGDLLLGGGSGESQALRISLPEAIRFLTQDHWGALGNSDGIFKAYWSMTAAFVFGEGYSKTGWNPKQSSIELWLVEHIVAFILREYPEEYMKHCGTVALIQNGLICRLPDPDTEETSL